MKNFLHQNYIWVIFLAMISLVSLAGEFINNKYDMADLEVYYKTADRLIHGQELYRSAEEDPYEHYVYKYSPPGALLFTPFLLIPYKLVKLVYWFLLTFLLGHILILLRNDFLGPHSKNKLVNTSMILVIASVGTHFIRELHLGQVNLLLLWFYTLTYIAYTNKRPLLLGLVLAITIFIKPFGLIFIPFILLRKRFLEFVFFIGFLLALFFIPLIFYTGIDEYLALYGSWFNEISIELGNKQDLLASGNHTLFSVLARYTPLGTLVENPTGQFIYEITVMGIIALLFLWQMLRNKSRETDRFIYILLIGFIPLLAVTSYNAYIFTLPLILYLMLHFRVMPLFAKIIFVISCLLIGGNIYDLVGRSLFDLLWSVSVYTWGTIGLILVLLSQWKKFSMEIKTDKE
ncbi:MAG TPA: glycosyltransferase family 87 protein [Bacteroidales bacterium]|nr:glycosyltransferase family 87 protein [Bacteroidales bacterium]